MLLFSSFAVLFCIYLTNGEGSTTTETPRTTYDAPTTTDCTDKVDHWSVDYLGNSGQFKLKSECNSTLFIKIKMKGITEYDTSDKKTKNKVTSFAGKDFEWVTQDGENTEYQGVRAIKNTYVATFDVGQTHSTTSVAFNLTTIFFLEDGNISINNDTSYSVARNTLKWEIVILDWPFFDSDNTLEVCMDVQRGGSDSSSSDDDSNDDTDTDTDTEDSSNDGGSISYGLGNDDNRFTVEIPLMVELDNTWYDEDDDVIDVVYTKNTTKKVSFCWEFSSFNKSLYYDPFVFYSASSSDGASTSTNGNENMALGWVIFAVAIAIVLIGALAYYGLQKRKQNEVVYQQMEEE